MKKHLLNEYTCDRLQAVEQQLSAYGENKDPEQLHLARIEIKKIKALLSFSEHISKNKYNPSKIKLLFRKAGIIREFELNIQTLEALPIVPVDLCAQLKKKQKKIETQFFKKIPNWLKNVELFRKTLSLPTLPGRKKIKKYFRTLIKKAIKSLETENINDRHRFRKIIKEMMYVYHALPKKIRKTIKLNADELDDIQQKTGDWHDLYWSIDFFSHLRHSVSAKYLLELKKKEREKFEELLHYRKTLKKHYIHI